MKVSELKEMILHLEDHDDVDFMIQDGCCGDTLELELDDYGLSVALGHSAITFKSLPGYKSCLQASQTKRDHLKYWEKVKGRKNDSKSSN